MPSQMNGKGVPTKNASALYEPLNEYKPFGTNIGAADGPFEYASALGMKLRWLFTTRMTIVQLPNGDLFLHLPIAYNATLAKQLESQGRIRHLVSPNRGHYAHIGEWARAFPDAVTWASPRVRERARSQRIDIHFERDLGPEAPEQWRDKMDQAIIPGAVVHDICRRMLGLVQARFSTILAPPSRSCFSLRWACSAWHGCVSPLPHSLFFCLGSTAPFRRRPRHVGFEPNAEAWA
jgi:hypothetical protein